MRNAETVLGIIRERGKKGLPLEDIYRQLYNREPYLLAYGKLYRNQGAMTPGTTSETVDGMSLEKIDAIIELLRYERYRWTPVRRTHIPKEDGKKRPLGIPTWGDKLLQEVIRMILEAYYEPQFSTHSHGFRPERGCHTALKEIKHNWRGTVWFIEGDISKCFDTLDHEFLLRVLGERLKDNRFLRLIEYLLKAGYLEEWRYHATYSGSPQGGVISPILSNIYLDRLDKYVEETLLPRYNRGIRRKFNREYVRLNNKARDLRAQGRHEEAEAVRKQRQPLPAIDPFDPDYRRLRYVRYADDFLLGFTGPRSEAEEIKRQLGEFLREHLKLELSQEKTLITHAAKDAARFLGYEVVIFREDTKLTQGQRSINGNVGLRVPVGVLREKCQLYLRGGKPIHRPELFKDTAFSILAEYQSKYRGLVEYYQLAYNLHQFRRLKWLMEISLTKTLAGKFQISVPKVYERFGATIENDFGTYKGLRVTVEREGKKPLVATWGGIPLRKRENAQLDDQPAVISYKRTELLERLLAQECELCGSTEQIAVHHVRALKDLNRKGRREIPEWKRIMARRRRKTLVVCHRCHVDIHGGRLQRHSKE